MTEPAITRIRREAQPHAGRIRPLQGILGRTPSYTELGYFSVMWSEHCSYKNTRPLLKTFPTKSPKILVGAGKENAGIIDIGDGIAIAFKMESHNHPSAVEPFQGAATGVGGIVRDIFTMGPGRFARSTRWFRPITENHPLFTPALFPPSRRRGGRGHSKRERFHDFSNNARHSLPLSPGERARG